MPTDAARAAVTDARADCIALVRSVIDLTPRMRRLRLEASAFASLELYPAQDVTLRVPAGAPASVKRRYTVRRQDRPSAALDIDIVVHEHGPGGRWVSSVKAGDRVEVAGPRGKVRLADVEGHLFAADEAGLPAVAAMTEVLPATASVRAYLEVANAAEEQPVEAAARLDLTWLHRGGDEPGRSRLLVDALATADLSGVEAAYLFTESRLARELRLLLIERGLSPSAVIAKGYWNLPR